MATAALISGVPTAPGIYSFTITITDASGVQCVWPYTLVIDPPTELLQFADLSFQGAFLYPDDGWAASGITLNNSGQVGGLAVKYEGDPTNPANMRLLGRSGKAPNSDQEYLFEMSVPTLLTSPPYNKATITTAWGDLYQGQALQFYGDLSEWQSWTLVNGATGTNGSPVINYSSIYHKPLVGTIARITDGSTVLRSKIISTGSGTFTMANNWTGSTGAVTANVYGYPSDSFPALGMCWDDHAAPGGQRLYYGFNPDYSGAPANSPSVSFTTLDNPSGPSMTSYGPWRFHDASGNPIPRQTCSGYTLIPDTYANTYLGGAYLAVGAGGIFSGTGNESLGPTLYACIPPPAVAYSITIYTSDTDPMSPNDGNEVFSVQAGTLTKLLAFASAGSGVGRRDNKYENRFQAFGLTSLHPKCGNVVSANNTGTNGTLSGLGTATVNLPPGTPQDALAGWRLEVVSSGGVRQEKTILTSASQAFPASVFSTWGTAQLVLDSAWSTIPDNTYTLTVYKAGGYGLVASAVADGSGTIVTTNNGFSGLYYDQRIWGGQTASGTSLASASGFYNGATFHIIRGTGAGQSQVINSSAGYTVSGSSGTFKFPGNWTTLPDNTSVFAIDGPRFYGTAAGGSAGGNTITLDPSAPPLPNTDCSTGLIYIKDLVSGEEHVITSSSGAVVTIGSGADGSFNPLGSTWQTSPNGHRYIIRKIGHNAFPAWPGPSRGYMTEQDFYAGVCWIDTSEQGLGNKAALLFAGTRALGHVCYLSSALATDYFKHTIEAFDPLSLLPGQANWNGSQPDAAWEADVQFPDFNYVGGQGIARLWADFTGSTYNSDTGYPQGGSMPPMVQFTTTQSVNIGLQSLAWDKYTNKVFMQVSNAGSRPSGAGNPLVYVYQILTITTKTLPGGNVGVAYSQTLATAGGNGALSFAVTAGSLPAGLSLNTATGAITGTPTTAGTYAFTIKLSDAGGGTTKQTYSVTIS